MNGEIIMKKTIIFLFFLIFNVLFISCSETNKYRSTEELLKEMESYIPSHVNDSLRVTWENKTSTSIYRIYTYGSKKVLGFVFANVNAPDDYEGYYILGKTSEQDSTTIIKDGKTVTTDFSGFKLTIQDREHFGIITTKEALVQYPQYYYLLKEENTQIQQGVGHYTNEQFILEEPPHDSIRIYQKI